ncbi:MAG: aromatic ring-hydroxylating dioxygenase subunit alpha [Gammaproteobacteria bacterium]|nr:aromatic ring-hydroxylating dioxygenase subunit alpha [Gammaproteobacteria bacterium]
MTKTLQEVRPSLPASWYYDPDHYRLELVEIWYRDWICVGHIDALKHNGDFFTARIGDQNIIVTRASKGDIRAWHNTCRHRGSILCAKTSGRFRNGRIICPYHTWTYSVDGELVATPGRIDTADFDAADYSLYEVHADTWRGFVFVNLSDTPAANLADFLGDETDFVANWPLEDLRPVHQEVHTINCNWKIYWENFSECYHCPRVHPELCKVMPVYAKAVFDEADVPGWQPLFDGDKGYGRVADDAITWTMDGQTTLPLLEGPTDEERDAGLTFMSITSSFYIVAHPDYVRSVRIVPKGPERIDLVVDWLLPASAGDVDQDTIDRIRALPMLVIEQDGAACELNQKGLRSNRFERGMLVSQEYELWHFHEWLRSRLDEADPPASAKSVSRHQN